MMPSLLGQPATAGRRDRSEPIDHKSVLFCQNCGHESAIDGDWRIANVDRQTRREKAIYTCPECARTVAARPDSDGGEPAADGETRRPGRRRIAE